MYGNVLKNTAFAVGALGAVVGIGYNAHQSISERQDREAVVSRLDSELAAERERIALVLADLEEQRQEGEILESIVQCLGREVSRLGEEVSPERLMAAIERVRSSLVAVGPGGYASGFFINDCEYIVTNAHVSGGMRQRGMAGKGYLVTLNLRGRAEEPFTFYAPLLQLNGKDGLENAESSHHGGSDVAILCVPPNVRSRLPEWVRSIELRDVSLDPLRDGERVIVAGNPFVLRNTVTAGILSNSERHFPVGPDPLYPVIQVDAEMNSGSSGGITADLDGRLIGISFYGFGPGMHQARHVLNLKAYLAECDLLELSPGEQAILERWECEWEAMQERARKGAQGAKEEHQPLPE